MKLTIKTGLLVLTLVSLAFSGCKKGENDNFLSLKSRKNRLHGDWKVVSYNQTLTYDGETQELDIEDNHGVIKYNGEVDQSFDADIQIHFDKQGTMKWNYKYTFDDGYYGAKNEYNWHFSDKNKSTETKRKEDIILQPTRINDYAEGYEYNFGYSKNPSIERWKIDRLTNNELIMTFYYEVQDDPSYPTVIKTITLSKDK